VFKYPTISDKFESSGKGINKILGVIKVISLGTSDFYIPWELINAGIV
jgi:hypothetical protein